MTTWVLAKLSRATREQAAASDAVRVSLAGLPSSRVEYIDYLRRIYGFEVPIESAFALTDKLAETVDLRSRRRSRLLKADLQNLGVTHPGELGLLQLPLQFRTAAEALGWMYVVDRSALLHAVVLRHVSQLPFALSRATSYLTNGGRGAGPRLDDLGLALDEEIQTPEMVDQVIDAAMHAFAAERAWFDENRAPRSTEVPREA